VPELAGSIIDAEAFAGIAFDALVELVDGTNGIL
jgi:hypothetical protein